jgi:hypothetical protein
MLPFVATRHVLLTTVYNFRISRSVIFLTMCRDHAPMKSRWQKPVARTISLSGSVLGKPTWGHRDSYCFRQISRGVSQQAVAR